MFIKAVNLSYGEIQEALEHRFITVANEHGSIEFINPAPVKTPQLKRQCEYCGSICIGDHPRCESCGAPRAYI